MMCLFQSREGKPNRSVAALFFVLAAGFLLLAAPATAQPADSSSDNPQEENLPENLDEAREAYSRGQYQLARAAARKAIDDGTRRESWPILLARSFLVQGQYQEAMDAVDNGIRKHPTSIRLRLLGHEAFTQGGNPQRAKDLLRQVNELGANRLWAYRDPLNLTTLGQAALLLGADPKLVLDNFFDRVREAAPDLREPYLASGELALDKHDYDLAAKTFQAGLKFFEDDPDFHYGLAAAHAPGDRQRMLEYLSQALVLNERHVPSRLLLADHFIDSEAYDEAEEMLNKVLEVNPWHPEAWAYRAVLAHLKNDSEAETHARQMALHFWEENPVVDSLIGKKLSQKYRFAEGAGYQRQALEFDKNYLPAQIQLAQDLLRLGNEEEGWRLAEQVHQRDGYDVTAYNLTQLRDTLLDYATLTNEHFVVRMAHEESVLYGKQVLGLLERARQILCDKYGMPLEQPVVVELFASQSDFAVRTFGMPNNPGFLGVCFGNVITANSPASQVGHAENWRAVLWHEFCHVITLGLTRNKMPRWLSEGISVYEERQENPAWGQVMTPEYRKMILEEDELTPVGELSAAFLAPPSPEHIQFAYYESSLVVEFMVQRYGLNTVRDILRDLGEGVAINEAISRHTEELERFETQFAEFARERAEALAPELDFAEPQLDHLPGGRAAWDLLHQNNYYTLKEKAASLLEAEQWEEAKEPLRQLIELYPSQRGPDNAYRLLAEVHRQLDETEMEYELLSRLAELSADSLDAYARLMELNAEREKWEEVQRNAERYLAVNPLVPLPYRYLARAAEHRDQADSAEQAYRALLVLDPTNPAELHYNLARWLHRQGEPNAKRHVLRALEEAPRFREAHRLLLRLAETNPEQTE